MRRARARRRRVPRRERAGRGIAAVKPAAGPARLRGCQRGPGPARQCPGVASASVKNVRANFLRINKKPESA